MGINERRIDRLAIVRGSPVFNHGVLHGVIAWLLLSFELHA